jgi:ribonuclease-3
MLSDEMLQACQDILKYRFKNTEFLNRALTHASAKTGDSPSNERMEFLGDSVLGLIIAEYLFENYPEASEGELTQVKSVVVSTLTLAAESRRLGLDAFFQVGKGMMTQSELPKSILANVFEAVVAAIYLDGGMIPARKFVLSNLSAQVDKVRSNQHEENYKSILQHFTQREMSQTPYYRVVSEAGPEHEKNFLVVAVVGDKEFETAWGSSKKDAEQKSAKATLIKIGILDRNGTRIRRRN